MLAEVTKNRGQGWNSAIMFTGVRGYGYPEGVQDARKVPFKDGDLVHGVWLHAGIVSSVDLTIKPSTFLSLEPSTKYVAQLVVGELRNSQGKIVTNQIFSGTPNSIGKKPKPVFRQVCLQTADRPS